MQAVPPICQKLPLYRVKVPSVVSMPLERLHGRQVNPPDPSPPPPYEVEDSLAVELEINRPPSAATLRDPSFGLRAHRIDARAASTRSSLGAQATAVSAPVRAAATSARAAAVSAPAHAAATSARSSLRAQAPAASVPTVRTREIIEILSDSDDRKPVKRSKKSKGKGKRPATPEILEVTSGSSESDTSDSETNAPKKHKPSPAATRVVKDKKPRPNAKVYFMPGETPPDTPPATDGDMPSRRSLSPVFPFPLADASSLNLPPRTAVRELAPFPTIPPLGMDDAPLIFDNINLQPHSRRIGADANPLGPPFA